MSIKVQELTKGHAPKRKTKGAAAYDCKGVTDLSRLECFDLINGKKLENKTHLFHYLDDDIYDKWEKGEQYDPIISIAPHHRLKIPLGFSLEFPSYLVAKIYLRSSLGFKTPLFIPNSVGVIDSDYRGELSLLISTSIYTQIDLRDRLCQLTFEHLYFNEKNEELEIVEALSDTERGQGGFGSTGK